MVYFTPRSLYPGEIALGIHWTGAGVEEVARRKIP